MIHPTNSISEQQPHVVLLSRSKKVRSRQMSLKKNRDYPKTIRRHVQCIVCQNGASLASYYLSNFINGIDVYSCLLARKFSRLC